ncbi:MULTISPECIES: hypothetical protein [Pseudomonas]|jgi:hypothetical protein|uniref:hypothetical protein n=1 Tax=Pseudomonas TaxID=286 RepID=UPI00117A79B8|nr:MULTISPECIES: hypothetical protein [Pseudomonas]WIE50982.1 hypothetical protein PMI20_005020 [Pseudomonas sp. GM17]
MEAKVYANKDWQHIGIVEKDGNLYADGEWCFKKDQPDIYTCKSTGLNSSYLSFTHVKKIDNSGDTSYPYSGPGAKIGQLVIRLGENGLPVPLNGAGFLSVKAGQDLWMRINDDSGLSDNDGYLTLRIVQGVPDRAVTNSYGDPIGTQYRRNSAGGYDKI